MIDSNDPKSSGVSGDTNSDADLKEDDQTDSSTPEDKEAEAKESLNDAAFQTQYDTPPPLSQEPPPEDDPSSEKSLPIPEFLRLTDNGKIDTEYYIGSGLWDLNFLNSYADKLDLEATNYDVNTYLKNNTDWVFSGNKLDIQANLDKGYSLKEINREMIQAFLLETTDFDYESYLSNELKLLDGKLDTQHYLEQGDSIKQINIMANEYQVEKTEPTAYIENELRLTYVDGKIDVSLAMQGGWAIKQLHRVSRAFGFELGPSQPYLESIGIEFSESGEISVLDNLNKYENDGNMFKYLKVIARDFKVTLGSAQPYLESRGWEFNDDGELDLEAAISEGKTEHGILQIAELFLVKTSSAQNYLERTYNLIFTDGLLDLGKNLENGKSLEEMNTFITKFSLGITNADSVLNNQ